jgi:serine-type D-Ala-D-Ala carboxypeptidase (penicillin-binding protein 5/6)
MKRRICTIFLAFIILMNIFLPIRIFAEPEDSSQSEQTQNDPLQLESNSAVLIEGSTGEVIYEKNKDERLPPASITKIMTMLLIFEALEEGKINLTDEVTVSEHAASLGGSQVYLEPYEIQTVETMIKCISIASANDASVAMAEFVAGSEEEFISRMNARAKELGMNNTNFVNSYGLDDDNHYSSAYDVALMSQELITKFPEVSKYATVWMDTIIHTTKKGESEFGLTNTNRLIRFYNGITGLKTGSTGLAKYCLSATAKRDGMDLIAVIMAAPSTKVRFAEASKLLDYGFANCKLFIDSGNDLEVVPISVAKGVTKEVSYKVKDEFSYLCMKDTNPENITKEVQLEEKMEAPVNENDKVGEVIYFLDGKKIGTMDLVAAETIEKASFKDRFFEILDGFGI